MHGCQCSQCQYLQDDKGGLITALAALEACLKGTGRLPVNVKVGPTSCICSLIMYFKHSTSCTLRTHAIFYFYLACKICILLAGCMQFPTA